MVLGGVTAGDGAGPLREQRAPGAVAAHRGAGRRAPRVRPQRPQGHAHLICGTLQAVRSSTAIMRLAMKQGDRFP
jgi:hypothetical protein